MAGQEKKKGSAVGRFVSTTVLILAIGVFAYAAWTLFGYYREYKKSSDEYADLNKEYIDDTPEETETEKDPATGQVKKILTDVSALENPATLQEKLENAATREVVENGVPKTLPMLRNPVNFTELHTINEDIIGWLRVGALDISLPVCQAEDNDYYLHRTFERTDNFAGCLFLNCDNSRYFTDQNSVIYGHNMRNGSMFGTLKKLQTQETYDSNQYFWVFTENFIYQYRMFSVSIVSKIGDPYRVRFTTEEFGEFLQKCQSSSMIDNHGLQVGTSDRITTLSTCTGDESTRLIVQGVLAQVYCAI